VAPSPGQVKVIIEADADTLNLRKAIKHLLVDLELDRPGSYDYLLPRLKKRLPGRYLNKNIMRLAMTGFRDGTYQAVLIAMKALLEDLIRQSAEVEQRSCLSMNIGGGALRPVAPVRSLGHQGSPVNK